ncbi:MAG: hypothetical protein DHS20C16_19440 [Phycisphaerae bacterium]|nr:MAG: hypothetical protein DHS20C16_19440 [Phycisphaerae bacterium]
MFKHTCVLGSIVFGLLSFQVFADEPTPPPTPPLTPATATSVDEAEAIPRIDVLADKRIREMGAMLSKLQKFRFSVEIMYDEVEPDGQKVQLGRRSRVEVMRPNGLRVESQGDRGWDKLSVFDGKHFLLHDRGQKIYSTVETPGTLDKFFQFLFDEYGVSPPLVDFLVSDVHASLTEGADSGALLGDAFVAEKACDHIVFSNDVLDWQIWIEKGAKPLPRKFVITYKDVDVRPQYTAIFREWDSDASLDAARFTATPPADIASVPLRRFVDDQADGDPAAGDSAANDGATNDGANAQEVDSDSREGE